MEAFERIISVFPKNFDVLDVGAFGHEGENCSVFLAQHFNKVLGFNINNKILKDSAQYPNYEIIIDNFYDYKFGDRKFDLVVLDLTIESNLINDWQDAGFERIKKILKPGGYLINFVMMTTEYGDPNFTPDLIKLHLKKFWEAEEFSFEVVGKRLAKIKDFEVYAVAKETRRPYILWVCLKKNEVDSRG